MELAEENDEAGSVYMAVRGQMIAVANQVMDLSIPAIKIVMDLYGVRDQRECLRKVLRVFHAMRNRGTDES